MQGMEMKILMIYTRGLLFIPDLDVEEVLEAAFYFVFRVE